MSNVVPPEEQFYSVAQVAALFSVSRETVRTWVSKGLLEAINPNGHYRITRASVKRLGEAKFSGRPVP